MKQSEFEPLDEHELERLDEFLLHRLDDDTSERIAAAEGDEGILDLSELDGFLTALVSGPNALVPSRWLPAVWGDEEPIWESGDEFQEIFELIVRHQNSIAATLSHDPRAFEPMFAEYEDAGKRYFTVHDWCYGYLRGVDLDARAWSAGGAEELLHSIELWAGEESWQRLDAMSDADQDRERNAIAESVRALYRYWLDRRAPPLAPVRRAAAKVGRNDPCPCGSGKKYKHCCLQ